MTETQLLPDELIGEWHLDRVVHDRLTGQRHAVEGVTTFEASSAHRITWREEGTMTSPFGVTPIRRELSIVRGSAEQWDVLFADERLFHQWDTTAPMVHLCDSDTYVGRVAVERTSAGVVTGWTMSWDATGPQKDYRIESSLVRSDSGTRG
jgi:Family of unknown function (DUF6314)